MNIASSFVSVLRLEATNLIGHSKYFRRTQRQTPFRLSLRIIKYQEEMQRLLKKLKELQERKQPEGSDVDPQLPVLVENLPILR